MTMCIISIQGVSMATIILYLDFHLSMQSVPITIKEGEFDSHPWNGVLDTTLCN